MDYEKKYKESVEKLRYKISDNDGNIDYNEVVNADELQDIFPELAESEDERIRQALLEYFGEECDTATINGIYCYKIYAWLEKQDNKETKKESIWKHWKDGIAGNGEGEQTFLIKSGLRYSISSCLWQECDYIELSELDELLREEKQGKSKWTEEDKDMMESIIDYLKPMPIFFENTNGKSGKEYTKEFIKQAIKWIKTIEQRLEE